MSDPDKVLLKNKNVFSLLTKMFAESFRNGSQGIAYEISHLLVQDGGFPLSGIKSKIYIWQGELDKNVPKQWAEIMHKQFPDSELKIVSNEGHLLIFNHAQEIFAESINQK